jgi:hypothetical protein
MNRVVPGIILALLLANVFLVTLDVKPAKETATLADNIASILNNVNFNTGSLTTTHYGIIFNKLPLSAYDSTSNTDGTDNSFDSALWIKRMAQVDGYTSATLNANAKNALQNMAMIGHILITYDPQSCWLDYHRFICEAFDWAQSWGVSRWDEQACFNEVLAAYQSHGSPLLGYPSWAFSSRYYDEYAESLDIFNKLNGSDQGLWQAINDKHWSSSAQLYGYTSGSSMYECEAGPFAFIIAYYRATHGNDIPYFDRIATDLGTKFLANGWSSPAWGQPGIVQHATSNPQLRLENTFIAMAAMQLYYKIAPWQTEFINMLNGTTYPMAWQAALNSRLFNGTKFAMSSDQSPDDTATATGLMMLFFEGIVPDTGSLAVPISEERYEDTLSFTPASNFNYDSNNHRIRIPVWAGTLKFQFGSQITSANFPSDGVYEVQFSSDWNTVTSVNDVSSLSPNFYYMNRSSQTPSTYNATVNAYCSQENNYVNVSLSIDGVPSGFTPCTFAALTGTHTFAVPSTDQDDHLFMQCNTGQTSTTVTVSSGGTYTAYYRAPVHAVAITDVTSSKTVVGQGYSLNVTVTVADLGDQPETFDTTAYANATTIYVQAVNLESGASTTLSFAWNTTNFAYDNYTISAYASPVQGENDTTNNTYVFDIPVHVGFPGDVSSTEPDVYDGIVNMKDIAYLVVKFNTFSEKAGWDPNADVNNDGLCNMSDIAIAIINFNKHE